MVGVAALHSGAAPRFSHRCTMDLADIAFLSVAESRRAVWRSREMIARSRTRISRSLESLSDLECEEKIEPDMYEVVRVARADLKTPDGVLLASDITDLFPSSWPSSIDYLNAP